MFSLHESGFSDGGNMSCEQAWIIGGNDSNQNSLSPQPQTPFPQGAMGLVHGGNDLDQNSQIPWPQTPLPQSAMGLGMGHGGPHLADQRQENWVIFHQTNPYQASSGTHQIIREVTSIPNVLNAQNLEASIRSHQFTDESPMMPIALDAQCSSFVPPQHATPIWDYGVSQQQINDQVLMDASNARTHADLDISMLLPETAIPYRRSLYPGQHVQSNQLPILDADSQSHDSTMHETSMLIQPQYLASYQQVNQAPFLQNFANNADAGIIFSPPASSIPQSPLGFSNEAPPIIPNLNPGQSQFINPEMDGGDYYIVNPYHLRTLNSYSEQESRKRSRIGDNIYKEGHSSSTSSNHFRMDAITQEPSRSWMNLEPANSSSQSQGSRGIINSVYDPMYETIGLPIDPHLRMFLANQLGNPSSSGQNATWQSNSEWQPWRLPDN